MFGVISTLMNRESEKQIFEAIHHMRMSVEDAKICRIVKIIDFVFKGLIVAFTMK